MKKKYVMTKKRREALAKARRKWKKMSPRTRAKKMPGGTGKISNRRSYKRSTKGR